MYTARPSTVWLTNSTTLKLNILQTVSKLKYLIINYMKPCKFLFWCISLLCVCVCVFESFFSEIPGGFVNNATWKRSDIVYFKAGVLLFRYTWNIINLCIVTPCATTQEDFQNPKVSLYPWRQWPGFMSRALFTLTLSQIFKISLFILILQSAK